MSNKNYPAGLTGKPLLAYMIFLVVIFGVAVIPSVAIVLLFGMDLLANFMSVWEPTPIGGVGEDDVSGMFGTGFVMMGIGAPLAVAAFLGLMLFFGGGGNGR